MPFDSNGNYTLPTSYFVENGDTVLPIQHNPPFEDVAQALSLALLRDGRSPMSGDLNMGTKKISNLADATAAGDAVNKSQIDTAVGAKVAKAGDTMTGTLQVGAVANAIKLQTNGNIDAGSTLNLSSLAGAGAATVELRAAANGACLIDFSPNSYGGDFNWRIIAQPNNAEFDILRNGVHLFRVNSDGNLWSAYLGWLSDRFADRGARVQREGGIWEFGSIDPNYNARTADAPAPYVLVGLRSSNGTNVINLRAELLRNN